jgi:hypothetical protein
VLLAINDASEAWIMGGSSARLRSIITALHCIACVYHHARCIIMMCDSSFADLAPGRLAPARLARLSLLWLYHSGIVSGIIAGIIAARFPARFPHVPTRAHLRSGTAARLLQLEQ